MCNWDYRKCSGKKDLKTRKVSNLRMGFFGLFDNSRIEQIDRSTKEAFSKVKSDADTLNQWVAWLYHQNQQLHEQARMQRQLIDEQKLTINELKVMVQHVPKTPAEIKQIVDAHYNLEPIMRRIKHIEQKIELIEIKKSRYDLPSSPLGREQPSVNSTRQAPVQHVQHVPVQQVQHVPQKQFVVEKKEKSRSNLHEKMMRRLARNSKEYIKNMISGLVHKYGKISALQLREMVVDEQGLCSKSSFYRIIEEMEKESVLNEINDGKMKVFVAQN